MQVKTDLSASIGNTPLIRLQGPSKVTGCEIYGKAEFMNPGQSIKDRAALFMIRDAITSGALETRRYNRRGNSWQHRYWFGTGRGIVRFSNCHRYSRHPKSGKKRI